MTKNKGHQKFWRMKIEIFCRKGEIRKNFDGVREFFLKQWGNLKQEGKCIIASGRMDAPDFMYFYGFIRRTDSFRESERGNSLKCAHAYRHKNKLSSKPK